jgi:hypothetical protein
VNEYRALLTATNDLVFDEANDPADSAPQ